MGGLTEADMIGLLRQRHTKPGNGGSGEWAFLAHVRNDAAFNANRTFDAVAMGLWPSRGLALHVFEVKVSRSDWQRELSKPEKAEDACKVADYFWIAAPAGVVKPGELPPTWGLIEAVERKDGWKLITRTAAPRLTSGKPAPLARGLMVGMLRSCPDAVPGGKVVGAAARELEAARQRGVEEERQRHEQARQLEAQMRETRDRSSMEAYQRFRDALIEAGMTRWDAEPRHLVKLVPQIVAAHRGDDAARKLKTVRDALERALEAIDEVTVE